MGLSSPRKRAKLSNDPNNTRWTNDAQSFGHKIMASQGWKPGEYLGAKDAPHAELHTAANLSHIRVMIKDDNLGLGAKIGSGVGHGECTGLDAFKTLLGRLNGKDEEELAKEKKSRDDLKRAIYSERKWGSIRFVQGGFLIGDRIQHLIDGEAERLRKLATGDAATSDNNSSRSDSSSDLDEVSKEVVKKSKKSKKRKLEEQEEEVPGAMAFEIKKSKKKRRPGPTIEDNEGISHAMKEFKVSKKKLKMDREAQVEPREPTDVAEPKRRKEEMKKDKRDRKKLQEKSQFDDEKKSTKESRKKSIRGKRNADLEDIPDSSRSASRNDTTESTSTTPTADSSGRSTPMMQGRHAVRSRNIAQKRLASMDVASLNQIFMIKSQS